MIEMPHACRATITKQSILLNIKSPGVLITHLIGLQRIRGWSRAEVLNLGLLDWVGNPVS